jgi:hypothetical protein
MDAQHNLPEHGLANKHNYLCASMHVGSKGFPLDIFTNKINFVLNRMRQM